MKSKGIAEPEYDYEIEEESGDKLVGNHVFTTKISIIKCIKGRAIISINSHNHELKANYNFLLLDSVLFNVLECSDDFLIRSFRFSFHFFNEIFPMLDNEILSVLEHSVPDLYNEEELESADLILSVLYNLHKKKDRTYRNRMVINLVVNYLLELYELTYKHVTDKVNKVSNNYKLYISDMFCALCNDNHLQHRKIRYYADKLNISSRYLHKIIKESLQVTPKELIDSHVSGSAKRMLLSTTLNIQQIANKLNFPDQATFGQFFKRTVGLSPLEFRNKYK